MEQISKSNRTRPSPSTSNNIVDLLNKRPRPPNAHPCEMNTSTTLKPSATQREYTSSGTSISRSNEVPNHSPQSEILNLEDPSAVPYRILIQLRFKRPEEWNELYDRFMIFSRQWHLESIMGVLEYIIDSSLSQPFVVKVPASHLQDGHKPFVQTLDLQFVTEARHNEFQDKWLRFQKKYASYDNAMAFTLGMDLLFGVIPTHFLEFGEERLDKLPTEYQEKGDFWQGSEYIKPLDMSNVGEYPCTTQNTEGSGVVDLSYSKGSVQQETFKVQTTNMTDSTRAKTSQSFHLSSDLPTVPEVPEPKDSQRDSQTPSEVNVAKRQGSRRKSTPQKKRVTQMDKTAKVLLDEYYPKQTHSCSGSDSGFLTDPEGAGSQNGDDVVSSFLEANQDPTINFLVQDLQVVGYLAQTVKFHRIGHTCFEPLLVNTFAFKDSLVSFTLQCSLKHTYQIDLFYEVVDGNCHVYG